MARQSAKKGIDARLTAVERGIRSLQANNITIIKDMQEGFARIESRLEALYNHVDGFMKLHETLDIELKVMKEQMKRLEERVTHLEAAGRS